MTEIKVVCTDKNNGNNTYMLIDSTIEDSDYIRIHPAPFNNCQIFSIASVHKILCVDQLQAREIFKFINNHMHMSAVIVDIQRELETKLEAIFPVQYITFKQQYENTNGSLMSMYLIKIYQYF